MALSVDRGSPAEAPDLVLRNAAELVTLEPSLGEGPLGVVRGGALVARGGVVRWVGKTADLPPEHAPGPATQVVDAAGRAVVPGLVDCHTHAVYAGDRATDFELRLAGQSYAEIAARGGGILTTVDKTRAAGEAGLVDAARPRLFEMLRHGVTTAEVKSGYGLSVEGELAMLRAVQRLGLTQPIDLVPTFLGAHTLPREHRGSAEGRARYVDLVVEEMLPTVADEALARFCDVYVEEGVAFDAAEARRILGAARALGMMPKLHVDQLKPGGGAELAAELGAVSADHLEFTGPAGIAALAKAGVVAVLLPGASLFLGGAHHAPGRALRDAGVELAIATDCNPGTSPTESLPLCGTIACTTMKLLPAEALRAMTLGAARALGLDARVGSLLPGKQADLVELAAPDWRHLVYRFGSPLAARVWKRGKEVFAARA